MDAVKRRWRAWPRDVRRAIEATGILLAAVAASLMPDPVLGMAGFLVLMVVVVVGVVVWRSFTE
ncbi:MAG: hypothetical protein KY461_10170 [Actinobacteria bacterium]|nr:hypothetical protein [Actinomycetota bacterium]